MTQRDPVVTRPVLWRVLEDEKKVHAELLEKLAQLIEAGVEWRDIKVTVQVLNPSMQMQATVVWPARTEEQKALANTEEP